MEKAIEHLLIAEKLAEQLDNTRMKAYATLNLGRAYLMDKNYTKAKNNFRKTWNYRKTFAKKEDIAVPIKYLADAYNEENILDSALYYYKNLFSITDFQKDRDLLSDLYNQIAIVYLKQGNYELTKINAEKSLQVAQEVGTKYRIKNAYSTLAALNDSLHNYKDLVIFQKLVMAYSDSLYTQELTEKIMSIQFTAEQQKKQAEIDLLHKEKEKQRVFIWSMLIIIVLTIILIAFLIYSNYQRKRINRVLNLQKEQISIKNFELNNRNEEILAQRDEIEQQKLYVEQQRDEIQKQQKQITDSIHYAQRIQSALFPKLEDLKSFFNEAFVLLKPRDVVSGDFYWYAKKDNKFVLVVADCTGHGVPGAFMSMLGISALNELMGKYNSKKLESNQILEDLRMLIKKTLKQTLEGGQPKDGMDMGVCVVDNENYEICFSGANIPLYFIRNNELQQIKPVRNPVGIYLNEKPFVKNKITYQKQDLIYMMSDGYASQFGGDENHKIKSSTIRTLLLNNNSLPIMKQKDVLNEYLLKWKGVRSQVDDILIVGVRF